MKLKFSSDLAHQQEGVNAVVKLFEGIPLNQGTYEASTGQRVGLALTEKGVANQLPFKDIKNIVSNIQKIQEEYELSVSSEKEIIKHGWNFTIEMETGTGKTYTYLRTIYELNKTYGFQKFIIVVPSVAIREGTLKNLEITHQHFQDIYDNPPINYTVYESKKISNLRSFTIANTLQILVINIDSFTKDSNVINQMRESGIKPVEYIQSTNPIVIVDEPQNMETDIRKNAINNLNPLCTLRYSATHKNIYNLIYKLDPVQAYQAGLVKQIEVDGITVEDNFSTAYIKFEKMMRAKNSIKVKLKIYVNNLFGVKAKSFNCGIGKDLYQLSNGRDVYQNGFIINSIDARSEEIEFANGLILSKGEEHGGMNDEMAKFQIERAIRHHFEKEYRYWQLGNEYGVDERIKVITLFFIDKVKNYRDWENGKPKKGKYALFFEELFDKYVKVYKSKYRTLFTDIPRKEYFESIKVHATDVKEWLEYPSESVHNGYFSQDRKGVFKDTKGNTKADVDTYNLIMKDKERLLSFKEPLRFIFSHSALREGWDNPNVFQICTLNETRSEIKKRQEIGRGLRLSVRQNGERCFEPKINILTIISNESYNDFCKALQTEMQEEVGVDFTPQIKNARKKVKIKLSKELTRENYPAFFEIWDRIKQKTRYKVEYDTDTLIEKAVRTIKIIMPKTSNPLLMSATGRLSYSEEGIKATKTSMARKASEGREYLIPDIYAYIQSKVTLTRSTIYQILTKSGRLEEITTNPQLFLDNIIICIKNVLQELMIDGISYHKVDNAVYEMRLFENEEIETYLSNLVEVKDTAKTLFNYVPIDSNIESKFAEDCDADDHVEFYFKLPRDFKITTPIGNYNPDWAVVFKNEKRIYFVAETKSDVINSQKRRVQENLKIQCGQKHFDLFKEDGVRYAVVNNVGGLFQAETAEKNNE